VCKTVGRVLQDVLHATLRCTICNTAAGPNTKRGSLLVGLNLDDFRMGTIARRWPDGQECPSYSSARNLFDSPWNDIPSA
jgi:hypothetical protein